MSGLADRTSGEVVPGTVLVVPVGSTEQHGPHLPLTTDTDIATALAALASGRCPGTVTAPAVAYGSAGEHAGFPGTLSIGQEATELLLVELLRSASATFAAVVLVTTHGGNAGPVARAVTRAAAEGIAVEAWSPAWPGDAHAGRTETAVMLALDAGAGPGRPLRGGRHPSAGRAAPDPPVRRGGRGVAQRCARRPHRGHGRRGGPAAGGRRRRPGRSAPEAHRRDGRGGRRSGGGPVVSAGGRVALVTGAARGIGAATVRALAADGWRVVAVDRAASDPRLPYPLGTADELHAVVREAADGTGRWSRSSPTPATPGPWWPPWAGPSSTSAASTPWSPRPG